MRVWFHDLSEAPKEKAETVFRSSWADILQEWMLIELDFQDLGLDLEGLLSQRSWRWFRIRLLRIMGDPNTRLHRALRRRDDG